MADNAFNESSISYAKFNGAKAGVLYAQRPTDGSGDLSVVRATTATRVNSSGLIESVAANVPRIDYTGGLSCGELLVEPQRTNLITRSSYDGGTYTTNGVTISAGSNIGALSFTDYTSNASNSFSSPTGTALAVTAVSGRKYGFSLFVNTNDTTAPYVGIRISDGTDAGAIYLDTSNNTISTDGTGTFSVSTLQVIGSGVVRIIGVWSGTGTGSINLRYYNTNSNVLANISNNNTGDVISIDGAQFEEDVNYVTSFIPTSGSTVTRNADVISKTSIASLLGDSEGALFVEAAPFEANTAFRISLSDGTTNNRVNIAYGSPIFIFGVIGGVTEGSFNGGTTTANTFSKLALRYALNNYALYQNGSSVGTDTSVSAFPNGTLTRLGFDIGVTSANSFYGRIRQLVVFDQALTNDELIALTS